MLLSPCGYILQSRQSFQKLIPATFSTLCKTSYNDRFRVIKWLTLEQSRSYKNFAPKERKESTLSKVYLGALVTGLVAVTIDWDWIIYGKIPPLYDKKYYPDDKD